MKYTLVMTTSIGSLSWTYDFSAGSNEQARARAEALLRGWPMPFAFAPLCRIWLFNAEKDQRIAKFTFTEPEIRRIDE